MPTRGTPASAGRKRCPRCRVKCISKTDLTENPSEIIIADGPQELLKTANNEDEARLLLWAYLSPQFSISDPTPFLTARMQEAIRELLGEKPGLSLRERHESTLSISILPSGEVSKTKTVKTTHIYPGITSMPSPPEKPKSDNDCEPTSTTSSPMSPWSPSCLPSPTCSSPPTSPICPPMPCPTTPTCPSTPISRTRRTSPTCPSAPISRGRRSSPTCPTTPTSRNSPNC